MANQIEEIYDKPDAIAGVATGAIGIGALVADYLNLPFCYVRPEAKSHGRQNKIEGYLESGQSVVVVEDLISTGGSSLKAVEALRQAKVKVKGMVAIFTYGFPLADKNFKNANVNLNTLSDYRHLLIQAEKASYITADSARMLGQWRENPSKWKP
tara:strand:- start:160 stop:624 length:465 start_codon:yes stop_codon:yes gene_type:complete